MADYIDETEKHIKTVEQMIDLVIVYLVIRKSCHDYTKLCEPEKSAFAAKKLSEIEFGSEEYQENLKKIKDALDHHYEHNSHHPEHFLNMIDDMTLIDIIEMFCDWESYGNIYKSIKICRKRFNISDQLANILINTAKLFEEYNADIAHLVEQLTCNQ